jgi:hypothetical protein
MNLAHELRGLAAALDEDEPEIALAFLRCLLAAGLATEGFSEGGTFTIAPTCELTPEEVAALCLKTYTREEQYL